jgi:hypothetical protein
LSCNLKETFLKLPSCTFRGWLQSTEVTDCWQSNREHIIFIYLTFPAIYFYLIRFTIKFIKTEVFLLWTNSTSVRL